MTTRFQVGRTYQARSICDYDCIISVTVERRTAKRLTAKVGNAVKTLGIGIHDNAEFVRPWGRYSMAPIVSAAE